MSARALVVLVILLSAVLAALFWLGRGAAPEETPAPAAPLLPAFVEDALEEISVDCPGAALSLEKDASQVWRITRPEAGEADPRRVHELVAALKEARVRKVVSESGAEAKPYGLSPATCTVSIASGAGTPRLTLRLGRSSPVGTERYAEGDDARVVLTDGSVYTTLAREAQAYRERRLIPVDPETIMRIAVDRPDGRLVLARTDHGWRLYAPQADAASETACAGLARAMTSIELARGAAAGVPANVRPDRRLRLQVDTRGGGPPRVAFIAAAGVDGKRLAWREGSAAAGLVDESAVRELMRPATAFRNAPVPASAGGS